MILPQNMYPPFSSPSPALSQGDKHAPLHSIAIYIGSVLKVGNAWIFFMPLPLRFPVWITLLDLWCYNYTCGELCNRSLIFWPCSSLWVFLWLVMLCVSFRVLKFSKTGSRHLSLGLAFFLLPSGWCRVILLKGTWLSILAWWMCIDHDVGYCQEWRE